MIDGPRGARVEELADIVRLSNRVFYPDGRIEMGSVLPLLFRAANARHIRVMTEDGSPVAMAGMVIADLQLRGITLRAGCVGSVCTLPEHRGHGMARRLMDDAVAHAVSQGASLLLVSGARGLYRRMACMDAGLFRVAEVDRADPADPAARVRPWTETDTPALVELHAQEPVRFLRAPSDMALLLGARAMFCRPARTWVVERAGRIEAYLCVSGPDDRTGPGVVLAREHAGSRQRILEAAGALRAAEGARRLDIEVPASDELAALAEARGLRIRTVGRHGTLKIIDRKRFLEAIAPLLGGRSFPFPESDEDLAALVFGSAERPAAAPATGPFPLPLPGYGMNYV